MNRRAPTFALVALLLAVACNAGDSSRPSADPMARGVAFREPSDLVLSSVFEVEGGSTYCYDADGVPPCGGAGEPSLDIVVTDPALELPREGYRIIHDRDETLRDLKEHLEGVQLHILESNPLQLGGWKAFTVRAVVDNRVIGFAGIFPNNATVFVEYEAFNADPESLEAWSPFTELLQSVDLPPISGPLIVRVRPGLDAFAEVS